jgi:predicted acylesterase/phospholipase RssA
LNSSGIEQRKQSQADQPATANTGYGKAGKQSALSNFPTATTTTNYNPVWDTDSEGKVNLVLDRVALPYSELSSFNDLPIPFACVATELVSGKQHVFRDDPFH